MPSNISVPKNQLSSRIWRQTRLNQQDLSNKIYTPELQIEYFKDIFVKTAPGQCAKLTNPKNNKPYELGICSEKLLDINLQ